MARVHQLVIKAEHKPGILAAICSEMAKKAVNISAIMAAYDQPGGQIRLVATPHASASKVVEQMGLAYREEEAVAIRVTDRPGALGRAIHCSWRNIRSNSYLDTLTDKYADNDPG